MKTEQLDELITEQKELDLKLNKLDAFIKNQYKSNDAVVSNTYLQLLEEQLHYMRGYNKILKIRLFQEGIKV